MIIKEVKYFPFNLKFKNPFHTSRQFINQKDGFILSIKDELNNLVFGECSPLPNFSRETKEQAEIDLNKLKSKLLDAEFSEEFSAVQFQLLSLNIVPSVQFAIEQAFLSLLFTRNRNLIETNNGDRAKEINVNAVIGFNKMENIINAIGKKIKSGYSTFKVKVGKENFKPDLELIKKIRTEFGKEINLRLDANCFWTPEEAAQYLQELAEFNIQYIEEPCRELINLIKLAENSPIPIAIDESINSIEDIKRIIHNSKINFIVVKPIVIGGIFSILELIKEARSKNKIVIISSSFESPVGKSALVFLASKTKHTFAHGLDTSEFFENNLCDDPYKVSNGKILFDSNLYPPKFELSLI